MSFRKWTKIKIRLKTCESSFIKTFNLLNQETLKINLSEKIEIVGIMKIALFWSTCFEGLLQDFFF